MSKSKSIALPIILSLLAAAIVAVVVVMRKRFKYYPISDYERDEFRVWYLDPNKQKYMYAGDGFTCYNADMAKVNVNDVKTVKLTSNDSGEDYSFEMIPVKAVRLLSGEVKKFGPNHYVLKSSIETA